MIDDRLISGCAVKVIAYRIDPEQLASKTASSATTTRGDFNYDISDLDLSSAEVYKVLAQNTSIRLPYDSGLCWNLNLKDEVALSTNIALSATPLDAATQEFYTKYEDMDAPKISISSEPNRLELSWKNAFNMQNWQTRFTTYLKAKKKKLIGAYDLVDDALKVLQEDVIRKKTTGNTQEDILASSNIMPSGMTMTVLTPYVISVSHEVSVQEVNNACTIVFNSDPNATNSAAISTSGSKALASPIDIYATAGMPALYENDIIEVRVKYLSGYVPLPEEGSFIDSEGYYRTFMGFVTNTSGSIDANGSQSLQVGCHGISKIFNLFTATYMPAIAQVTDAPTPAVVVENGLEQSKVLMTVMSNVYNNKTLKQIMQPVLTDILNGQEATSVWNNVKTLATRGDAKSVAPSINSAKPYDATFYRQYLPKRSETSFMLMHQLIYNFYIARQLANIISTPTSSRENTMADVFATMERTLVKPYNVELAKSFSLYNTQFKSLSEVFREISVNTGHEIFEDSPGVLRIRPPKYNVLTLEPENLVFNPTNQGNQHVKPTSFQALPAPNPTGSSGSIDVAPSYVIDTRDLKSITIDRDDTQLKTRADTNWLVPLAGKVVDNAQYYSDPGGLMRYGFRHIGPVQTPLATNMALAKAMSAIYLATANSTARTATVTVFNNREYKAGRLYYIPLDIPDGYSVDNSFNVVSRGVVGYVISKAESLNPNGESICELRLAYLRVAEILKYKKQNSNYFRYFANFKRLPDIDTFVRLTVSNKEAKKALAETSNSKEEERPLNSIAVPLATESVDLTNGLPSAASEDSESAIPQVKYYNVLTSVLKKPNESFSAFDFRCGFKEHSVYNPQLAAEVGSYKSLIAPLYADNSLVMDRNLLSKLTVYDLDPQGKIYENISLGPLGLINTHSTFYGRDTRDLLLLLHTAACHGFETHLRETITALGEGMICDKAVTSGDPVNITTRPELLAANLDVPSGWYDKIPGKTGILKLDSTLTLRSTLSNSKWVRFRVVTGLAENPFLANIKYGLNPLCSCIFIRLYTTGYTGMPSKFVGDSRLVVIPMPTYLSLRLASLLSFGLIKYNNGSGKDGHTAGQAITASDLVQTIWPLFPVIEYAYEFKERASAQGTDSEEAVRKDFLTDMRDLCRNPYNVRKDYGQSRSAIILPWEKSPTEADRQTLLDLGVEALGLPIKNWVSASTSMHGGEVTQLMRQGFEDVSCAVPIADSVARKLCAKLALQNQPTYMGGSYPSLYVTLGKNFTTSNTTPITFTSVKDTVFTMPAGRGFSSNLPPGLEQVEGTAKFEMVKMYGFLFTKRGSPSRGKSSAYDPSELLTGQNYISATKFPCGIHTYTLANYEYVETYVNKKESAFAKQINYYHRAIPSQVGAIWREYNDGLSLSFQNTDSDISEQRYTQGRLNLLRI